MMKDQIVILSTADFDSAVWTNKQHLAVGLSDTYDITYIESLGLRRPTLSASDVRRITKKLISKLHGKTTDQTGPRSVPVNMKIISPQVIPFHNIAVVRWINERLLHRQLKSTLHKAEKSVFWTFSPLTYGLHKKFATTVYHSVDLLHTLPGVPGDLLLDAERKLIPEVNYTIASSRGVAQHLEASGAQEVMLWENVAHTEVFSGAVGLSERHDRVVFAGNLTPTKIDFRCLQSILDRGIKIAIAGPMEIDGAGSNDALSKILESPLVEYHGNLALPKLAELLASSKAGVIPYLVNEYTQGVFPMKVYEYLAAGLNVISTALPSLAEDSIPGLSIEKPEDFGLVAQNLIGTCSDSSVSECVEAAASKSWTNRIKQAQSLISGEGN